LARLVEVGPSNFLSFFDLGVKPDFRLHEKNPPRKELKIEKSQVNRICENWVAPGPLRRLLEDL
jgi:hypothetical protein